VPLIERYVRKQRRLARLAKQNTPLHGIDEYADRVDDFFTRHTEQRLPAFSVRPIRLPDTAETNSQWAKALRVVEVT
jgi:hypothetical protein